MVPLLETGMGMGIGEVVLGGRRWDDKGDELAEFWWECAGDRESSARSGSSRDFFFVRNER